MNHRVVVGAQRDEVLQDIRTPFVLRPDVMHMDELIESAHLAGGGVPLKRQPLRVGMRAILELVGNQDGLALPAAHIVSVGLCLPENSEDRRSAHRALHRDPLALVRRIQRQPLGATIQPAKASPTARGLE